LRLQLLHIDQLLSGTLASFTITARDSAGNRRSSGGDTFLIALDGNPSALVPRAFWHPSNNFQNRADIIVRRFR
jgi:hypothetical protein